MDDVSIEQIPEPRTDPRSEALVDALGATERMRYEQEIRRLRRDLELRDLALRDLGRRLHQAELDAATTGGRLVEETRAAYEQRAIRAEAALHELEHTKLFRLAAPLRAFYARSSRTRAIVARLTGR